MTTQAKTLYPAGFVETEDCEGPRLVRSQPSRETCGITLEQCESMYGNRFGTPNTEQGPQPQRQGSQRQGSQQGPKKIEYSSALEKFENFQDQDLATFLNTNFKDQTEAQVFELLDTLVGKNTDVTKLLDQGLQVKLKAATNKWLQNQTLIFYANYQTGTFLFLMILLFFLIGLAITV